MVAALKDYLKVVLVEGQDINGTHLVSQTVRFHLAILNVRTPAIVSDSDCPIFSQKVTMPNHGSLSK